MEGVLIVLILVALVIFVLPIAAFAKASRAMDLANEAKRRQDALEGELAEQRRLLSQAKRELESLRQAAHATAQPVTSGVAPPAAARAPEALSEVATEVVEAPVEPPPPAAQAVASSSITLESDVGAPQPAPGPLSSEDWRQVRAFKRRGAARGEQSTPPANAVPVGEPAPAASPALPAPAFEWERWLGVRGAAVLGGIVFALAGFLFFRYAIDHGLISPTLRVVLGTLAGIAALVAAEKLRERYAVTANAMSGGGMVVLYASFWAARSLYHLIPTALAFALMTLTTAAGCLLATRSRSLLIAVLGLVGGFLTPLLLSTGEDRPVALFGYVLLLDVGFVYVAYRRGWSVLLGLSLLGTLLLEGLWIGTRMGPERVGLGLLIVAVFVALFGAVGARPPKERERAWRLNQAAGLVLPLGFALYFASQARFGTHLWPIVMLLGLVAAGASYVARKEADLFWLPSSVAVGALATVCVWLGSAHLTTALAWELASCVLALGLVFQVFVELRPDTAAPDVAVSAALITQLGGYVALIVGAQGRVTELWPWLFGFAGLSALLLRQAQRSLGLVLALAAGILPAIGLVFFQVRHGRAAGFLEPTLYAAIQLGLALALQGLSLWKPRREYHLAAGVFPFVILLGPLWGAIPSPSLSPLRVLGPQLAFGALCSFAVTRTRDGRWLLPAAFALFIAESVTTSFGGLSPSVAREAFALKAVSVLFISLWSALVASRLQHARFAVYTSAFAGAVWFLSLRSLYSASWEEAPIAILPLGLGALSVGLLSWGARSARLTGDIRKITLVLHAAVALGFLSVAIPLQLDRQWITLGWALECAALLYLFERLDHAGLKWAALGLALVVTVRLILNPAVLDYEERGHLPFLNWLLYTYWVPALSLLAGFRVLYRIELTRARTWERALYADKNRVGAVALFMCVILIVFVWLNLAIFDAFAEGSALTLDFSRRPARDLSISLSWIGYAGALLAIGMAKGSRALRWLSLVFLVLSIGKVFLYDLSELRDLYRVLSLLGLAVSLLTVSFAYQRFVFRPERRTESP